MTYILAFGYESCDYIQVPTVSTVILNFDFTNYKP